MARAVARAGCAGLTEEGLEIGLGAMHVGHWYLTALLGDMLLDEAAEVCDSVAAYACVCACECVCVRRVWCKEAATACELRVHSSNMRMRYTVRATERVSCA